MLLKPIRWDTTQAILKRGTQQGKHFDYIFDPYLESYLDNSNLYWETKVRICPASFGLYYLTCPKFDGTHVTTTAYRSELLSCAPRYKWNIAKTTSGIWWKIEEEDFSGQKALLRNQCWVIH